jgi:hypothetical protein
MEQKNEIDIYKINTPIDVIKQSIGKEVYIKCKFNRELKGKLHVIYIIFYFLNYYFNNIYRLMIYI